MMQTFMLSCTFVVIGFVVNALSYLLGSRYLCSFLDGNLLLILIALLAINTTTVSVILTKMREIADRNPIVDFERTRRSMNTASIEQLILIILTVVLQIIKASPIIINLIPRSEFILESFLIAVFAFSVQIVFDTAKGIYVILDQGH